MNIAIACDHRGFEGKRKLLPLLGRLGHCVDDLGCDGTSSDYPDYAAPAARGVAAGRFDAAILLDGSGIGMSVVANKVPGVRAALVHDVITARLAREHNHCNVLCIGTDLLGDDHMYEIVRVFLDTPFAEGRHGRRIEKIHQIERDVLGVGPTLGTPVGTSVGTSVGTLPPPLSAAVTLPTTPATSTAAAS